MSCGATFSTSSRRRSSEEIVPLPVNVISAQCQTKNEGGGGQSAGCPLAAPYGSVRVGGEWWSNLG
jgi:hypothetical protein